MRLSTTQAQQHQSRQELISSVFVAILWMTNLAKNYFQVHVGKTGDELLWRVLCGAVPGSPLFLLSMGLESCLILLLLSCTCLLSRTVQVEGFFPEGSCAICTTRPIHVPTAASSAVRHSRDGVLILWLEAQYACAECNQEDAQFSRQLSC